MKKVFFIAAAAAALLVTSSCNNDTGGTVVEAVTTVKGTTECYFQLNDKTILKPQTATSNPYGAQVRAHMIYIDYGKTGTDVSTGCEIRKISLTGISKILTKSPVVSEGALDPKKYGDAPMDIINSWGTVVEDGHITMCFRSLWGSSGQPHIVNLVKNVDPSDPYLFEFRQDYNGDVPSGYMRYGIVAFDISDIISDHDKTYNISVRHIGIDGETRTAKFQYKFGESAYIITNESAENSLTLDAEII